jgi:hypothetical protein
LLKIRAAIESKSAAEIRGQLMSLLMGSRTDTPPMPQALNVLKFVDHVEQVVPGFRQRYERLSEFAHPNWAGTVLLFSKFEKLGTVAEFGEAVRSADSVKLIALGNLSGALILFEGSYDLITHTCVCSALRAGSYQEWTK